MCYNAEEKPELAVYPMPYKDLNILEVGQLQQKILCHSGDSVTIGEDTVSELKDVFEAVKIEGGLRPGEAPED